ncbi:Protein cwh43, partial [Desmophyllum pertusum]
SCLYHHCSSHSDGSKISQAVLPHTAKGRPQCVLSHDLGTVHFAYDNVGWPSFERAAQMINDTVPLFICPKYPIVKSHFITYFHLQKGELAPALSGNHQHIWVTWWTLFLGHDGKRS